jgi:DNA-binding CsgD family transcriptional regulator/tetratricopeptide (TPR) repeat protein
MELCTFPDHDHRGGALAAHRGAAPVGLAHEHSQLERLFRTASGGEGRAVVVRGPAGGGKTTLLEHALGSASGFCAVRIVGLESERDLPYAGLHRLCAPMFDRLDRLPTPQRDALAAAFGLRPDSGVDVLFLGLAVLGLFADVSSDQPLVCAVDDADRLDEPSRRVLALVARRIRSERIALVFTATEPIDDLAGLPELVLRPLTDADARVLLASVVPGRLDTRVRDRIVAESRGNRGALVGAPGVTTEQLAGGFGLPAVPPPVDTAVREVRERLQTVPEPTRRFVLLAAAEPEGDAAMLWRAAAELDIDPASADEAASLDLLHVGPRVTFHDTRVRSVAYHDAPFNERRHVHQALANVCDPEVRPDRRLWHRALAALAPDEAIAGDLERAAVRVSGVGGVAASAAFLERAALLTRDREQRARRALVAARAKFDAGSLAAASDLVALASEEPTDGLGRARLALLRAHLGFARGHSDAADVLLDCVRALEPVDARLARDTYLEAVEAAVYADLPELVGEVAAAATTAAAAYPSGSPSLADLLLDGLAKLFGEGHSAASPTLRRAVEAARGEDEPRWLGLASRAATMLGDNEAAVVLASRSVRLARETGALIRVAPALDHLAGLRVHMGDLDVAAGLLDEARQISEATGQIPAYSGSLMLAGWQGADAQLVDLVHAKQVDTVTVSDDRQVPYSAHAAAAVLHNGLGHYRDALLAARRACEQDEVIAPWVLAELVEAAARTGQQAVAIGAFERLAEWTQAAGTEWAQGIEARVRAVISDGDDAEKHYRAAVERLGRCRAVSDLARAHLLFGEWLRRERRRREARVELRSARELFSGMGALAFAARADHELLATGERARRRTVEPADGLTPRETQVVRLARDGRSNPQIGAELFISARTVEYHLRNVFAKLGIESRLQLDHALHG